jgi:hypothetical protein
MTDVDEMADSDGRPQPCSEAMDYQTAMWHVDRADGQLQMMPSAGDTWFLYYGPIDDGIGIQPKVAVRS